MRAVLLFFHRDTVLFVYLLPGTITQLRDDNTMDNYVHVVLGCLQIALREMQYSLMHNIYNEIVQIGKLLCLFLSMSLDLQTLPLKYLFFWLILYR